jgi:aspartyl-tRNA(Asn)/glutamyl-tRNA(Gln) amidotransferase subunit A
MTAVPCAWASKRTSTSVPCGFAPPGLPVGLQIVGARGADELVLRAGHAYQRATDWHLREPPV